MSTAALIHIKNKSNETIATILHPLDGYPEFLGESLKTIIKKENKAGTNNNEVMSGFVNTVFKELSENSRYVEFDDIDESNIGEEYVYTLKLNKRNNFKLNIKSIY